MAILDSNQTISNNVSGFEKTIHKSATTMMLDNLQAYIYQKPIQSAVRECVSNAVDAVKEKITAMKILKGEAKVSDYYLTKEDVKDKISDESNNIYEDSEFNPDYYDLKWLDTNDTVLLKYVTNDQTTRDQFSITDPGVGLGGQRLEGFFNLGYSSKRLNTNELGGFGLGAKSPLATGVESYRIVTRYNGKEFCFDIYSHKVDCVYSKWNDDGSQNDYYEFQTGREAITDADGKIMIGEDGEAVMSPGFKAYYKKTYEKNSTSLIIEVRKHNRQQYFEAVRSQLMYLKSDVKFVEENHLGGRSEIPFKATILAETSDLIIPSSSYYSRPHFVIKDIAYGIIDFAEMDLSPKFGAIGIKLDMEKIDVVPSRESVRYTTKTRAAILEVYDRVASDVQAKVQEELNQDSIVDWIRACGRVMYRSNSSNDPISIMSGLIDKTSLEPAFKNTGIKFKSDIKSFMTPLMDVQHISLTSNYDYSKSKTVKKITKSPADNITAFDRACYFQFTPGVSRVTSYLAGLHEREGGLCTIRVHKTYSYLEELMNDFIIDKIDLETFKTKAIDLVNETETDSKKAQAVQDNLKKCIQLMSLLKEQQGVASVKIYSEKLVPDSFKGNNDSDDDTIVDEDFEAAWESKRKEEYKELAKQRRENKIFIGNKLVNKRKTSYSFSPGFERVELKVSDLVSDEAIVVHGTDDDTALFNFMMYLEQASPYVSSNVERSYYWDDNVKMLKVAKSNLRYVKDIGVHVKDYVVNVDSDGVFTVAQNIKSMLTAAAVREVLGDKHQFLANFREFSSEVSNSYDLLWGYVKSMPTINVFNRAENDITAQTIKAAYEVQLQLLKHSSLDEQDKQDLIDSSIPHGLDLDIIDIDLIDTKMYEEAVKLRAFIDVYAPILWYIEPLSDVTLPIIEDNLCIEIKTILQMKKDQLEFKYENIN